LSKNRSVYDEVCEFLSVACSTGCTSGCDVEQQGGKCDSACEDDYFFNSVSKECEGTLSQ